MSNELIPDYWLNFVLQFFVGKQVLDDKIGKLVLKLYSGGKLLNCNECKFRDVLNCNIFILLVNLCNILKHSD